MTKVFFDVMASLDGFMAPEGMDLDHVQDPGYKNWMEKWSALTSWVFKQKFFRENLKLGEGGETGPENRILEDTFKRTGVSIMGKRMFEVGERLWPEEAPFHTPVYVVTHQKRGPWKRPGGTTFYFVNDGIQSALLQARESAGGRDIRVSGGANLVQQSLNARLIDEFALHFTPVFFKEGIPLFAGISNDVRVRVRNTLTSKDVTHVTYEVLK
jgi:dihydrofolate reductase